MGCLNEMFKETKKASAMLKIYILIIYIEKCLKLPCFCGCEHIPETKLPFLQNFLAQLFLYQFLSCLLAVYINVACIYPSSN